MLSRSEKHVIKVQPHCIEISDGYRDLRLTLDMNDAEWCQKWVASGMALSGPSIEIDAQDDDYETPSHISMDISVEIAIQIRDWLSAVLGRLGERQSSEPAVKV